MHLLLVLLNLTTIYCTYTDIFSGIKSFDGSVRVVRGVNGSTLLLQRVSPYSDACLKVEHDRLIVVPSCPLTRLFAISRVSRDGRTLAHFREVCPITVLDSCILPTDADPQPITAPLVEQGTLFLMLFPFDEGSMECSAWMAKVGLVSEMSWSQFERWRLKDAAEPPYSVIFFTAKLPRESSADSDLDIDSFVKVEDSSESDSDQVGRSCCSM